AARPQPRSASSTTTRSGPPSSRRWRPRRRVPHSSVGSNRPSKRPDHRDLPGLHVRRAGPEHWETYRDLRITSLIDSPRAFWTTYATAARWSEEEWRDRLGWPTWFAYAPLSPDPDQPPAPVGLVSLWRAPETPEGDIVLIQMWVASWVRGRGVTDLLMQTAVEAAR